MNANEKKFAVLVTLMCMVGICALTVIGIGMWSNAPWVRSVLGAVGTLLLGGILWKLAWDCGYWSRAIEDRNVRPPVCGAPSADELKSDKRCDTCLWWGRLPGSGNEDGMCLSDDDSSKISRDYETCDEWAGR